MAVSKIAPTCSVQILTFSGDFTVTAGGYKVFTGVSIPNAKWVLPVANNWAHCLFGFAEKIGSTYDVYFRNVTSEEHTSHGYKCLAFY